MNDEERWAAVMARDAAHDGRFVYAVTTTGVYCRPSCPSRRPLRRNVRFHASPAAAEASGARACKRCKPLALVGDAHRVAAMRDLCRHIERHSDERITLDALARRAGISPFHLQRSFKALVGVSPREYAEAVRVAQFKRELRSGRSVTDAAYEAGYGSSSRVYEGIDARLGMTPREYRARGRGVEISYASTTGALGTMMLGATDRGLCFIQFGESAGELEAALAREYPEATLVPMRESQRRTFEEWMHALSVHLEGGRVHLGLPLDIRGTAFQMKVWRYLQKIPYGEVQSYGEVAAAIGAPTAARAVAQACGHNPVALAIPCHRVIRGSGEMGGYRWGVERKRVLIDTERRHRD